MIVSAGMAIIFKVSGFCVMSAFMDKLLKMMGKSEFANIVYIISYSSVAIYSIKFVLDHCHKVKIGW